MAKSQQIVGRIFLENSETGEVKPWEDLTEKEKQDFRKSSAKRLGESLSRYFTQHPEEYARI